MIFAIDFPEADERAIAKVGMVRSTQNTLLFLTQGGQGLLLLLLLLLLVLLSEKRTVARCVLSYHRQLS